MAPAFSQAMYNEVWQQSSRLFDEMVKAEGWDTKKSFDILVLNTFTTKVRFSLPSRFRDQYID